MSQLSKNDTPLPGRMSDEVCPLPCGKVLGKFHDKPKICIPCLLGDFLHASPSFCMGLGGCYPVRLYWLQGNLCEPELLEQPYSPSSASAISATTCFHFSENATKCLTPTGQFFAEVVCCLVFLFPAFWTKVLLFKAVTWQLLFILLVVRM